MGRVRNARRCIPLLALIFVFSSCSPNRAATEASALARGKKLLDKQDYSRALLEFKNAVQAMPKDAEPHYQAGLASMGQGDFQQALAYFNRAGQLDPNHTAARLKAAQLMAMSGNQPLVEEAEKRLTEMLQASSSNPELLDTLAVAEVRLNKTADAARHLQQALEKSPGHLASSMALAQVKVAQKDFAGAEEVLRRAVRQDSKSVDAVLAMARFYLLMNRMADGQAQVQRALEIDPKNGPALFVLAAIQVQTGRKDEAGQTYARLAALPDKQYKPLHALFLLQAGKADAAIAEFEKLAKADPTDRDARTRLVAAYASAGRNDQARKVLATALRLNAKDVDALLQRGQLALQAGQTAAAAADLSQVLSFRPDSAEAHLAMARWYAATGSPLMRRRELSEAVRLDARLVSARTELVQALLLEHNPTTALEVIRQAPEDQKELLSVVVSRVWAMQASGDQAGARQELEQRLAAARVPELVFQDAALKLWRKDYVGAQMGAEEVLKQNPQDIRALRLLVDSYTAQNKDDAAERCIRTSASQQPNSAPIQLLLGEWLMKRGDRVGARSAFVAAKVADPRFADADFALADLDLAEGRLDSARQTLLETLSRDAKNPTIHFRLAAVEDRAGNSAVAVQHLRTVVDLDNKNSMALNNLAYLLAKTDPDAALNYAQQAVELAPQNAAIQDTLGWVYYRKKLYGPAITHLKIAVGKERTPRHQFHLGMAYTRFGDQALGQQMVAAALKSDPNLARSEKDW